MSLSAFITVYYAISLSLLRLTPAMITLTLIDLTNDLIYLVFLNKSSISAFNNPFI
jgi:hypothetical protein